MQQIKKFYQNLNVSTEAI